VKLANATTLEVPDPSAAKPEVSPVVRLAGADVVHHENDCQIMIRLVETIKDAIEEAGRLRL